MAVKKLKILNIIGKYHPLVGGAEKECYKLSIKLKEMGHDINVLTAYKDGLLPFEIIEGVPVHRKIRGWHLYEVTYIISVLLLLFRFYKHFDCVICFGLKRYTIPAIIFCRLTRKKVFFRIESALKTGDIYAMQQLRFGKLILSFSKLAHGAIIISNEIEEELLKTGFPQNKIYKIPNTVDTNKFFPKIRERQDPPLTINFIGRLHPKKGIDILIKALKRLKDKSFNFRAFIVGDGELKNDLNLLVNDLKLDDRIFFKGTQKETLPFYQQADIIAMPSYAEGLPLVLLEAMACKSSIVATEIGGITDVIVKKNSEQISEKSFCICENGILVLPGDIEGLTNALEQLIQDRKLREKLSQDAYETVLESYALDKVILRYLDLLGSNSE